jgi:hypothetical protein
MLTLGVTPTSTRTVVTATTPGYKLCPDGVMRRLRADGQDPCGSAPSKVTVKVTPSAQELCKNAGIPTSAVAQQAYCQKLVLSAKERAAGKTGMDPAKAAAEALKKYPMGQGIVREGRKSVIYPACQQAGVPEASLEACYEAVKKGMTPEQQVAILQQIAEEMQAAQTGQQLPAGTIHYQDFATGVFHVAVPINAALGGFGQATYIEAGTTQADPTAQGSTAVTKEAYDEATGTSKPSLLKKWWFWAAIGGGISVLGAGTFVVIRRRRRG